MLETILHHVRRHAICGLHDVARHDTRYQTAGGGARFDEVP